MSRHLLIFSTMLMSGSLVSAPIDLEDYQSVPVNLLVRRTHAREVASGTTWLKEVLPLQDAAQIREMVHDIVISELSREDHAQARRMTRAILIAAHKAEMDPLFLVALMKTESQFNPRAAGQHGEIGLMQILPGTAEWIAKRNKIQWRGSDALYDPVYNIHLGTAYLKFLRKTVRARGGDHVAYVSAYNMGPKNVRRLHAASIKPRIYATKVLANYRQFYQGGMNELTLPKSDLRLSTSL